MLAKSSAVCSSSSAGTGGSVSSAICANSSDNEMPSIVASVEDSPFTSFLDLGEDWESSPLPLSARSDLNVDTSRWMSRTAIKIPKSEYDGGRAFGFSGIDETCETIKSRFLHERTTHIPDTEETPNEVVVYPAEIENGQIYFRKNVKDPGQLIENT